MASEDELYAKARAALASIRPARNRDADLVRIHNSGGGGGPRQTPSGGSPPSGVTAKKPISDGQQLTLMKIRGTLPSGQSVVTHALVDRGSQLVAHGTDPSALLQHAINHGAVVTQDKSVSSARQASPPRGSMQTGPRGGRYVLTPSGKKFYVSASGVSRA